MHNKLFVADNALGVTGGRNLGDAYFGVDETGNFVDLDVLAAGPIVQDLSRSFDSYWNNERAYPVQSLVKREELDAIRDKARADEAAKPDAEARPANARRAAVWDERAVDLRNTEFVWAPAAMLVDKPGKIAASNEEAASAAGAAPGRANTPGLVVTQPGGSRGAATAAGDGRQTRVENAAGTTAGSETLVEGLLQLVGQAQSDLLIISPYFVPAPRSPRPLPACMRAASACGC